MLLFHFPHGGYNRRQSYRRQAGIDVCAGERITVRSRAGAAIRAAVADFPSLSAPAVVEAEGHPDGLAKPLVCQAGQLK